jgi:hypothetical protein
VRTDDLVTAVGIALGQGMSSDCELADADSNLVVSIDELVGAVRSAMLGCVG